MILTVLTAAAVFGGQAPSYTAALTVDPVALNFAGTKERSMMYTPSRLELSATAPKWLKTAPEWQGTPQFAQIQVGNGPDSLFGAALDAVEGNPKLYIDLNQNGNLTDDGGSQWAPVPSARADTPPGMQGTVVFRAAYTDGKRTWRAPYGLNFYGSSVGASVMYYRAGMATGRLTFQGQVFPLQVIENQNNGVFSGHFTDFDDPTKVKAVWITIGGQRADARGTFAFMGMNMIAKLSPDGRSVKIEPTHLAVLPPQRQAETKKLLAAGTDAPEFMVETPDNKQVRLSEMRGKVVVLKFWATWCGPCRASMPKYERLWQQMRKRDDVALMAVCVSDDRPAYLQYVKANSSEYTFPMYFDPAGKAEGQSISGKLYSVSGIPTVYVIGRDGKVAASIVGYQGESDDRVEAELAKLGVLKAPPAKL